MSNQVKMPTISWHSCPVDESNLIQGREYLVAESFDGEYLWHVGEWLVADWYGGDGKGEFLVEGADGEVLVGSGRMVLCGLLPERENDGGSTL